MQLPDDLTAEERDVLRALKDRTPIDDPFKAILHIVSICQAMPPVSVARAVVLAIAVVSGDVIKAEIKKRESNGTMGEEINGVKLTDSALGLTIEVDMTEGKKSMALSPDGDDDDVFKKRTIN